MQLKFYGCRLILRVYFRNFLILLIFRGTLSFSKIFLRVTQWLDYDGILNVTFGSVNRTCDRDVCNSNPAHCTSNVNLILKQML